jgi:hypothetical protein
VLPEESFQKEESQEAEYPSIKIWYLNFSISLKLILASERQHLTV